MKPLIILLLFLFPCTTGNEVSYSEVEQEIIAEHPNYPEWDNQRQEVMIKMYTVYSYKKTMY